MKIPIFLLFILFIPIEILSLTPYGRWSYTIYSDGTPVGTTTITRNLKDGIITTNSSLNLNTDSLMIISSETIKETTGYSPVSFSSKSTIIDNNKINRSYIHAEVTDNIIIVTGLNINIKLKLRSDLIFGTNKIISDAVKSNFKDRESEYTAYDPSCNSKKAYKLKTVMNPDVTITSMDRNVTVNIIRIFTRTDEGSPLFVMEIYCDDNGLVYMYKINLDNKPLEFILDR